MPTIVKSVTYVVEGAQWDSFKNMVMAWNLDKFSNIIKSFVIFINSIHDIWKQQTKKTLLSN